jgi:hypothetical protein
MRLDAEDFELVPLIDGKGWSIKRLSASREIEKPVSLLTEKEECHSAERKTA